MAKKQVKLNNLEKKIQPLADRVLIKETDFHQNEKTKSGIIIPETIDDKDKGAHEGVVVAIGEGRYDDGILIPMKVKVGDTVLFQWGEKISIDDKEYYVVSETNILAIIK